LTDLSGYAKKSTANGDTRSGLRLRLRIAAPGRAADADPPQHLTCGKFTSRSLVAGFHRIFGRPPPCPNTDAASLSAWSLGQSHEPMVAARCGSRLTRLAGVAGAPQTDDLVVLSGESREGLELGETRRCSREVHTPASSRPCPHESSESTAWVGTPASSNVVRPRHDHVRAHQAEWCVGWQPRN